MKLKSVELKSSLKQGMLCEFTKYFVDYRINKNLEPYSDEEIQVIVSTFEEYIEKSAEELFNDIQNMHSSQSEDLSTLCTKTELYLEYLEYNINLKDLAPWLYNDNTKGYVIFGTRQEGVY